jgi:hypothetical protein
MFPWTHRSINSTKIPITYPAVSTAIIGATVTMLTSIVEGSLSGFSERSFGLKILFRIALSQICANLRRKLHYIKVFIHCHCKRILKKLYGYGCVKSNEKSSVVKWYKRHSDCKVREDIVTLSKKNPLLRRIIRQRVWNENSRSWMMEIFLQFSVYLT